MSTVRYRTQILGLTLAGFALRLYGLDRQSFWLDEVDAIAMAAEPVAVHLRKLTAIGENGPLYFLLFKVWVHLAGPTEFGARALSAFSSTLAIPLLGSLARALFHRREIAVIAAALAAASPFYVWFGQDAKMYPLFAALTLGAQWCLVRAFDCPAGRSRGQPWFRRSWPWWMGYVLCSSFALYVHIFAALQIAANILAGCALWLSRRTGWRGFLLSTLLLTAPYIPLAVWQGRVLLRGANVGYRPVDLSIIVVTLLQQFTWHLNIGVSRWWLIALALILALGFWRIARERYLPDGGGVRRTPWEPVALLTAWLVIPIALVYAAQFTVPVFRDRYLIPLVAPFLLVLAGAVAPPVEESASRGKRQSMSVLASLAAGFIVASFAYGLTHRPPNPDFRRAAAYVAATMSPGERLGFLAEYAERPFGVYFRRHVPQYERVNLPYTDYPDMTEQDGLLAVARSMRGGERFWVVRFEPWLWDSRDLLGQYLRRRGATVLEHRDFNGVSVTRYAMP